MDYKELSKAIRMCGIEPGIEKCKEGCPYYAGGDIMKRGDMLKCIPRMTQDAADSIDKLERVEKERDKYKKRFDELKDRIQCGWFTDLEYYFEIWEKEDAENN